MKELDIVIPVYNERENIAEVLTLLGKHVKTPFRVLICYDFEEDNTLPIVNKMSSSLSFPIVLVKNRGKGPHSAVTTGFELSQAPAVLVFLADDIENAHIIDVMYEKFKAGNDIVAASRFAKGGCMKNCRWPKSSFARLGSFTLYWIAAIPIKDSTNGFRLFSRRVIDEILIESNQGFTYALELLVKAHRMHWKVAEVPAFWHERTKGKSRFQVFNWLPHYLKWYFYAFGTTYLGKKAETVKLKTKEKNICREIT